MDSTRSPRSTDCEPGPVTVASASPILPSACSPGNHSSDAANRARYDGDRLPPDPVELGKFSEESAELSRGKARARPRSTAEPLPAAAPRRADLNGRAAADSDALSRGPQTSPPHD